MDLIGKIAVITGVSKGIGEALCQQLLAEGCTVFGLGRNNFKSSVENYTFISTDVRNVEEVNTAFETILKEHSHIDILINNAGLGYFGNVDDLPLKEWDEMMQTNVNGMFYCTRLAVPVMKKNGFGHIINIASTAGLEGMPMVSGYCATKWAVKGFSESLWRELRDFKIKVTCVYPGSVKTDFFRNSPNITPHDYMLMPEDVANMMVYALKTPDNFHQVNLEVRPLQPKGPKSN
ncbi:MAG: SDR family oxidoreductase [Bacteroidota bacterium]|nr:SDR family oxidoreductase [Bacteroidota bacterium]